MAAITGPLTGDITGAVGHVDHREHAALGGVGAVPEELGDTELLDDLAVLVDQDVVDDTLACRLGPYALRRHLGLEPGHVDRDVALSGDLLGELEREAVRVVEEERGRAGQRPRVVAELAVEDRQSGPQRVPEPLLLLRQHAEDEVAVLDDVRVGVAHHVDRGLGQARHHEVLGAEQVRVTHGAAQDPAQHVAASLVRREHTVAHQHRRRPGVLGEHAHGEAVAVVVVADPIGLARQRAGGVDQRLHEVGLPHRIDALQQGEDPLEPGAGVDRGLRQRGSTAVGSLVVLHEHQVPELHEAVALGVTERAAVGTEVRAAVDVDLAARSARTGVAHLPEVVLVAEALDALERHADLLVPDRFGLVVAVVDRDPQAVTVEAPPLGRRVPSSTGSRAP